MAKKKKLKAPVTAPQGAAPRWLSLPLPWLFLALALALYLRTVSASGLSAGSRALFLYPDSYYHLRRLFLAVRHFPVIPAFDSYLGFPYGGYGGWPPFFELLAALPALFLGLGHPSNHLVELCGAWLPPILGCATLLWAYGIGKRVAGRFGGLVAAFSLAVMWAHAVGTVRGYFDHDGAEVFFSGAFFLAILKSEESWRRRKSRLLWPFLAGTALAFGMLSWVGFTVFGGVAALYFIIRYAYLHGQGKDDQPVLASFAIAFLWAGLALFPFGYHHEGAESRWSYAFLSWLQPVLFLGVSGLAFLLWALSRRVAPGQKAYRWMPFPALALGLLVVLAIRIAVPQAFQEVLKGIGFIRRSSPWLETIKEFSPLFYSPEGAFETFTARRFLGYFIFLWPLVLPFLLLRRHRSPIRGPAQALLAVWTLVLFLMTLSEYRHAMALSLPLSIALGYGASLVCRAAQRWVKGRKAFPSWMPGPATVLLVLIVLWPTLAAYGLPADQMSRSLWDALLWVRDHTPQTSHYDEPGLQPEYGVLARWDYGHFLIQVARRPALATNFGTYIPGFDEAARFFLAPTESTAVAVLTRNRIRYLFLTEQTYNYPGYIGLLGLNEQDYRRPLGPTPDGRMRYEFEPPFFRLAENRLYFFDGLATPMEEDTLPALSRFRLLYESPDSTTEAFGHEFPRFKVFEFVPGARLCGKAKPGERVQVGVHLQTPSRRRFLYVNQVRASGDGRYCLTVPYANGPNGDVNADSIYVVKMENDFLRSVRVSETQVLKGLTINIP